MATDRASDESLFTNMESCLKLLPRNCYNTYSSVVLALLLPIVLFGHRIASDYEAKSSLQCDLDKSLATTSWKGKYIETRCLLKYAHEFLPSLPLNVLIAICYIVVVVLSVVYGYLVKHRVDVFSNNLKTVAYQGSDRYFVFMAYIIHLIVCRIIPLTLFSAFLLTSSNFPYDEAEMLIY